MTNFFVPLEIRTGTLISDFVSAHSNMDIIIWGAGVLGRCLMHQFVSYIVPRQMLAFTDSNPKLAGITIDDRPVLAFDDAIRRAQAGGAFLLVALAAHTRSAMNRLVESGLVIGANCQSYLKLSRPEAVIQVTGHDGKRVHLMEVEYYRAVLSKLKADIPDLFHVDLSGWGDPLDHPDIATIVEATRAIVPCTLTTRLDTSVVAIERALRAEPTQFVVVVDGDRDETFFDHLNCVAMIHRKFALDTEIRVKYTHFRNNYAGFNTLRTHCIRLGLKLVEMIGYIDPYDTILRLCETNALSSTEAARLTWSLRDALDLAYVDRARPCLCQRIFPVINSDGSVAVCHLYTRPRLHDDYLAVDYHKLIDMRRNAGHCRICQHHALHRLDIDVLQVRHAIILISSPEPHHA